MVLTKFRQRYPKGSLVSELVCIDRGTCIVRVSVMENETIIATGLAGADRVETAEDLARERAIALLMLDSHDTVSQAKHDLVSESKSQKDTVNTLSNPSPSVKSKPELTILRQQEDKKTVDFSDYPAKSEPSSYSAPPEPSFVPETDTEIVDNGRIIEEKVIEPEETAANSANLFEGTSNPDSNLISQDLSPDNEEISSPDSLEEVNFNEIKHQTDLEIKRLGWTKDDGREFLKSRYGKRSRLQLTDNQLLEFLQYLASQPSPS